MSLERGFTLLPVRLAALDENLDEDDCGLFFFTNIPVGFRIGRPLDTIWLQVGKSTSSNSSADI